MFLVLRHFENALFLNSGLKNGEKIASFSNFNFLSYNHMWPLQNDRVSPWLPEIDNYNIF